MNCEDKCFWIFLLGYLVGILTIYLVYELLIL